MANKNELNPFKIAQAQLDECAEKLALDKATHELLREPMKELIMSIPVKMDDGTTKVFKAFRVQYNGARGPTKGGLRWHPNETLDTVRALAAWMTWKTALVDIPLGGGKGGVVCNPKEMSEAEKERLARAYMRAVSGVVGVMQDVPAPDVYTTPQIMAWMMDEYEAIRREHHPGVITGKPTQIGGSQGRNDATARGGVYCVREAAKRLGVDLPNATFAIQGFGNAGQFAATLTKEILGTSRLVAVSDSKGGIYNPDGIEPLDIVKWKLRNGQVGGFPGTKEITNEELLELDVDILYPAALENVIVGNNAEKIRAKILCELANGPTTPEADKILYKNGVHLIPDFLANAGGVTVSYFEQVQNTYNYYWPLEEVYEKLEQKMSTAYNNVYEMHKKEKVHMRLAAYMIAVSRVAEACKLRGWV